MAEVNVERALDQLEELVDKLEADEVDLDDALKLFEQGVKLSQQVQDKLKDAELRIKQVIETAEGFSLEDFQL